MINRQKWNAAQFHEALTRFAGVRAGDQALDLGCGSGATLGPLLVAVGGKGRVTAVDRRRSALNEALRQHASAAQSGSLALAQADVLDVPFPANSFDVVICQNVVECVRDRAALVEEARRVLRPNGCLLLAHHDFDGVILVSDDCELARRLVHGFADHRQEWQDSSEGRMGRMIPGLVANAGFASVEIESRLFVDLDLGENSYAVHYLSWLVELAPSLGVDREAASQWAARLKMDAETGRFFFGLPWVGAICRKSSD